MPKIRVLVSAFVAAMIGALAVAAPANAVEEPAFRLELKDGAFEIRVAARSRAGNWLPTGGIERYALMLRLYDTPVGVATRTQRDAPMPSIATVGCP